jgi:hypothetical protein
LRFGTAIFGTPDFSIAGRRRLSGVQQTGSVGNLAGSIEHKRPLGKG